MAQRWIGITVSGFLSAASVWAQWPATVDLDVSPETLAYDVKRIHGSEVGASMGSGTTHSLAFGDLNADGFDDFVLGAPAANPEGRWYAGEVVVLFGGPAITDRGAVDLSTAPGTNGEIRIWGANVDDILGETVACGDVNGDGVDDLVLGSRSLDPPGRPQAGGAIIIYGEENFSDHWVINLSEPHGTHGETWILGDDEDDRLGSVVTCGDVNGDGVDDIIMGASRSGDVIVVYGDLSLNERVEIDLGEPVGSNGETRILCNDDVVPRTGAPVGSGDFNGDGIMDIVFQHYRYPGRGEDFEELTIICGSDSMGSLATLDLNMEPGTHGETRIRSDGPGGPIGSSLEVGDVNGDGLDDVAFLTNTVGFKAVGVFYGNVALSNSAVIQFGAAQEEHRATLLFRDHLVVAWGPITVSLGDVDSDGLDDIICGAPSMDTPGGYRAAGRAEVILGHTSLPLSGEIDLTGDTADLNVWGDNPHDYLGFDCVAGGDLNGDGFGEFAVSAAWGDNPSVEGTGESGLGDDSGVGYLINGKDVWALHQSQTNMAMKTGFTRTGDGQGGAPVPPTDFGPVLRCEIDFSDHDWADNGSGGASRTTVRMTTSAPTTPTPIVEQTANVQWQITTDRVGWTEAVVTFRYTDVEVEGLEEGNLVIRRSTGPAEPYIPLLTAVDEERNLVTATVSEFGVFELSAAEMPRSGENGIVLE